MAADILVYRATHVPVAEDQKQHLELARDIARSSTTTSACRISFPSRAGDYRHATRVMSLRDGTKKMSKSDESDMSRIKPNRRCRCHRQQDQARQDDPLPLPASKEELKDRPEAENLLNIYAALADQDQDAVIASSPVNILRLQDGAGGSDRGQAFAHRGGDAPPFGRSWRNRPHLKGRAARPAPSPRPSWTRSKSGSALFPSICVGRVCHKHSQ